MRMVRKIFYFYVDGFRSMTVGKTLWIIIIIKLLIIFLVFRMFLLKPALREYKTPQEKADKVIENLTK